MFVFILAGHDTTANALSFLLYYLAVDKVCSLNTILVSAAHFSCQSNKWIQSLSKLELVRKFSRISVTPSPLYQSMPKKPSTFSLPASRRASDSSMLFPSCSPSSFSRPISNAISFLLLPQKPPNPLSQPAH